MYTSVRNAPEVPPGDGDQAVAGQVTEQLTEAAPGTSRRRRITGQVGGTVIAMGAVSFLTDASAEMVTAVLPLFLILQVGLTPLQYGIVDGVYQGATVLVRLVGGYLADRWRRPKIVCTFGYGLSAVTKLGLLGVGSAASTSFVLAVDRAGKGIRTAPRDAVIAASTRPALLGRAFGVHRTLDTAGAMLGPLLAFLVLLAVPGGYHPVFVVSFGVAVLGVARAGAVRAGHPVEGRARRGPGVDARRSAGCCGTAGSSRSRPPPGCSAWSRSPTASST